MSEFRVFASKGFQIVFDNGYTISCMFGKHNYAEHRYDAPDNLSLTLVGQEFSSQDCEIAIIDSDGNFINWRKDVDQVIGWQKANDFAEAVNWIQQQK